MARQELELRYFTLKLTDRIDYFRLLTALNEFHWKNEDRKYITGKELAEIIINT